MSRVRVLVYAAPPDDQPDAVDDAYHRISAALAGTPGLVGNDLMRSAGEPHSFIVMSEWENLAAFQAWEQGQSHRNTTAPLRPYQDARPAGSFGLYEVVASY